MNGEDEGDVPEVYSKHILWGESGESLNHSTIPELISNLSQIAKAWFVKSGKAHYN